MPSGKRETERKGNAPVNTGPSPNSDGRVNNPVEEANEPARGSGPLQVQHVDEPLLTLFPTFTLFHHYAKPAVFVFAIRFDTSAPLCAALLPTALHSVASPR
ncbi:hypothetical protein T05_7910 [Trichinella murrelli]|uniref:Uncharacterized protein n=1 Tax=Trichinella murrelli TaxID=144512 RepID=A0A0V0TC81_9BILA|nr:hypothetical protein T05_7910 [Trichinella murrelli]